MTHLDQRVKNVVNYTRIPASVHDFYPSEVWYWVCRLKILDSISHFLWSWCSPAQRQRQNSVALQATNLKKKKLGTLPICQANPCGRSAMAALYSFDSGVTLPYSITAHTFLLNPITTDQCCLFHSCREMICLKVISPQHILGVQPA